MHKAHITLTRMPVDVKRDNVPEKLTPVRAKNSENLSHCQKITTAHSNAMIIMSTILSVTTVPSDLAKGMPSFRFRIPHLRNSPTLGITREAA